jgi:hypothetical protein
MKNCYRCKKEKPLSEFYKNKHKPDGYQIICKKCRAVEQHKHYLKNKKYYKKLREKQRLERKQIIDEIKKNSKCIRCGLDNIIVLEFHHRDSDKKEDTISNIVQNGWSIKRLLKELKKCDVICANCHKIIHHEKRTRGESCR